MCETGAASSAAVGRKGHSERRLESCWLLGAFSSQHSAISEEKDRIFVSRLRCRRRSPFHRF